MPKPLVIVESPAKAKTIAGFLGDDFVVESSIGHIRDLPGKTAEVPENDRHGEMARLAGVDPENDFKAVYISKGRARDQVKKLKQLLKGASELYLATDEDREGESIAWHLHEVLNPQVPVKRMVFHEITPQAIQHAVDDSRDIDFPLVDAQETRRILDRLYGWEISPVLWRKVGPGLSAGRVQSVATRLVVQRERERMAFRSASWWDLEGTFVKRVAGEPVDAEDTPFGATLHSIDGARVADRNSFDQQGQRTKQGVVVLDEDGARGLVARLEGAAFAVRSVDQRPWTDRPKPPFMTSTLQQAASSKFRWTPSRTMQIAQRLYENGYITYMRTDSTTLSDTALAAARTQATHLYGADHVPAAPRQYNRKVKSAQEAHEAIRPAGDTFRLPRAVQAEVGSDEARLYDLIWRRTIASQMKDAVGQRTTVRLGATSSAGEDVELSASGTVITFLGYRRAYDEGADDVEGADEQDRRLPPLASGDPLDPTALDVRGHETSPPNRYTEAGLVKALEELGIGRPSTYASIMSTILDKGYVWKKGSSLVPSWTAFSVVGLLESHFPSLVDYGFTAALEDDLDAIARQEKERVPWLRDFYFGRGDAEAAAGRPGLKEAVSSKLDEIDPKVINTIPIGVDSEGQEIVVRVGKFGPYLTRGEERASVPEELPPDELTVEKALALLAAPSGDRVLGEDPETGLPVLARAGRYGPYVQLGEAEAGSKRKPRTASLFKDMQLDTLALDDALTLLTLPRVVGQHPETGAEIVAQNGRYGPYLAMGSDSRSLEREEQLLTITLEEALAVYAQPKQRRGQQAAAPLKELGADPVSGKPIVLKEGRFGPYVTDGETNASLRKGDTIEEITPERAAELLADRRAAGPTKKAGRKAAGAKKAAGTKKAPGTKKASAKKAAGAKKATAKKAAGTRKTAGVKKAAATRAVGAADVAERGGASATGAGE